LRSYKIRFCLSALFWRFISIRYMITRSSTKRLNEQETFRKEGYLILENFIPQTQVQKALSTIKNLAGSESSLLDRQDIANHPDVIRVLEHVNILEWCSDFFSTLPYSNLAPLPIKYDSHPSVFPIPYKWLRSVDNGEFTGPHFDSFYVI
jgi:hypothetical protein